ncbi:hypothetical protein BDV25DRAFT_47329 [Aspergillus avenaceus]|uniref:Nephrocystin 3-like N-terminal domain-containing protein n=1 Tax=Aspergillus avenaceus TaxID=36643 RepID=A0A5N6TKL7_ASPAV|nr:hypothetical protein BDV25DRAFT_47329 [Aspergillus avenaceus]
MEALSALSVATAVAQFIDFGTKILSGAREIYCSTTGLTADNKTVELVVGEVEAWCSRLQNSNTVSARTPEQDSVCRLSSQCEELSKELLQLIKRCASNATKSKRAALRAAIKFKRHEGDRYRLLNRLKECQQQLFICVQNMDRTEFKRKFRRLADDGLNNLDVLNKKLDDIHRSLKGSSLPSDVHSLLNGFLDIPGQALAESRILQGLAYASMHHRMEQVEEAHFGTFRWILDGQIPEHKLYRERFTEWLRHGTDVFHITGKLGSGKSTLMKFLATNKTVLDTLNQWAEGRKLVVARFFFWRPGTIEDKTIDGLLRGLLHDVLKGCQDMIPTVFPNQWKESLMRDWRLDYRVRISKEDVRSAFDRLLHSDQLYSRYRICFFIDGLDELVETCHEDYRDIVELLRRWISMAPLDLKLCISLRNYSVFGTLAVDEKRLQLHELTRQDMLKFVKHRLEALEIHDHTKCDPKGIFVDEVVNRADGVFLWVALVLKSIRTAMNHENRLDMLLKRLQGIPRDMEALVDHLLCWDDSSDRISAYRTFALEDIRN